MAGKRKSVGFGPRPLTSMGATKPKRAAKPKGQVELAEAESVNGHREDLPEALAPVGTPEEGVAPQGHAPDEALPPLPEPDVPVWTPDAPGVPSEPVAITDDPLPEAPDAKTTEAPLETPEEEQAEEPMVPIEFRLRTRASDESMERVKGKILRDHHVQVLARGPAIARKPDGSLLLIYLPGVLREVMDEMTPRLSSIRMLSDNRGLASGSVRVKAGTSRTRTKPIMSGVMGSMDPVGPMQYCRLTAYTAKNVENWRELLPLWQAIAGHFEEHVPDRFRVQMEQAMKTPPEWVIEGTPFTTITINNSYSTGVHTDSGDLDEGFSTLAVARKGEFTGGILTFPQYGVGVDMQHGDLILMNAHEWHGNTLMHCRCAATSEEAERHGIEEGDPLPLTDGPCKTCGAERISVVAYYRTKMATCSTYDEEMAKKAAYGARRLDSEDENAADLAAVTAKA